MRAGDCESGKIATAKVAQLEGKLGRSARNRLSTEEVTHMDCSAWVRKISTGSRRRRHPIGSGDDGEDTYLDDLVRLTASFQLP